MPRKIRPLIADLASAGFVAVEGAKGSHRKFRHPRFAEEEVEQLRDDGTKLPLPNTRPMRDAVVA